MATKQRDISTSCLIHMHPTVSKSIRSQLRYRNSVISILISLNLGLKSAGSTTELSIDASDLWYCWRSVFAIQHNNVAPYCVCAIVKLLCREPPLHQALYDHPTVLT